MERPELKIFGGSWDFREGYPRKAIRTAMENPVEAIPELHAILQHTLSDAAAIAVMEGACLHIAAA